MSTLALENLRYSLEWFKARYSIALEISELYALFPEEDETPPLAQSHWNVQWPNSESNGVYAVFSKFTNDKKDLQYIGKASSPGMRLGHRLGAHFGGKKEACTIKVPTRWVAQRLRYIVTIPVPADEPFIAAALENI